MFFTNIAGVFAVIVTSIGGIIIVAGILVGRDVMEKVFAASGGIGFIFAGCMIGILVEISGTLAEIKKNTRAK